MEGVILCFLACTLWTKHWVYLHLEILCDELTGKSSWDLSKIFGIHLLLSKAGLFLIFRHFMQQVCVPFLDQFCIIIALVEFNSV